MGRFDNKKIKAIKFTVAILCIAALLSIAIYILFKQFFGSEGNGGQDFYNLVSRHPFTAAIVLVAASIIQVIIAFIPGEILEQAAGLFFGPWMGAILSFAGNMTGSILVMLIARKFGKKLIYALYSQEKIESVSFLREPKKRNTLTFILFLLPGTPKDLLTYAIGITTDMKLSHYIICTSIARIPSILLSTVSGNWIGDVFGDSSSIWKVIILNAIAAALCAAGYFIYVALEKSYRKHKSKKEESLPKGNDMETQ